MSLLSIFAIYFVIWWLVLFTTLPIGVRSQAEEQDITLGTEHGAPARPQLIKKMILTTIISTVIFAIFYVVTVKMGLSVQDLPRIVPEGGIRSSN